jgi:hypothetical protein
MLFLVVSHYKMRMRPAQARARPEPGPKIKARCVQWNGHGQDFFRVEIKKIGPTRKMLTSTPCYSPGRRQRGDFAPGVDLVGSSSPTAAAPVLEVMGSCGIDGRCTYSSTFYLG